MPLRILTNTQSLFAQANLGISQKGLNQALERLSSGLRINHAYDDPAGFLFALQMTFNITGEQSGTNNLHMAIDMLNTADSYTRTISEDMSRMSDLATQAHNGLLTGDQRAGLNYEFQELYAEIQRLATNASYNGKTLLDGGILGSTVQSGFSVSDFVQISINALTQTALFGAAAMTISTMVGASTAIGIVNSGVTTVLSPAVAALGAQAAGWMKSADAQDFYTTNLKAARSRIQDADVAAETTNLTNYQVIVQSGIAALAQANSAQTLALGLLK
jgi:flagellin